MKFLWFVVFHVSAYLVAGDASRKDRFVPQRAEYSNEPLVPKSNFRSLSLSPQQPFVTLDYGYEVAGYPFFEISEVVGNVQVEVKYAEELSALSQPWSDGPFDFSVGVSNSYRVETFAFNHTGVITSFLAQGGQRWQSMRLLTSGNVSFSTVGLEATIAPVDLDNLPSQFNSSSELYNDIWSLGARAVSAACFAAGSYRAIWEISSQNGARVRGMRPPLSTAAAASENYTLTFETKIERGGLGWALAWPLSGIGTGIQLNIVGNYPEATTFVNTNKTLLPPNSIVLAYGFGLVNQTTLPSYYLDVFEVPFQITEDIWYDVSARLGGGNRLAVSVNGINVFNVTLDAYYTGKTGSLTSGSFGFGGWQDQVAYVRNVSAFASNGTKIYSNQMTDAAEVLPEYGAQSNLDSVCLDGPKRDRLLWSGDFFHTSKIIGASTVRNDFVTGTLQTFVDWQLPTGQYPLAPVISLPSSATGILASVGPFGQFYFLSDYHVLVILSFVNYMEYSNDVAFAARTWSSWKLGAQWLTSQLNTTTGLFDLYIGLGAFLGPTGGTAVNGAIVQALNGLSEIAQALNDTPSATQWRAIAANTSIAINTQLWSEELGTYITGPTDRTNFSVAGIAFAITSGAAPVDRAARSIAALQSLKLDPGYKDSTAAAPGAGTDGLINISPNTNGFLLSALLQSNATAEAKYLLDNLWAAMLSDETTTTGASWEYVNTNRRPGLSLFTSLSHPWGGAPTYVLTEYVAGIRPTSFGYRTWIVEPCYRGFGVDRVSAKVKTPGGDIEVEWRLVNAGQTLDVFVRAPPGTSGVVSLKGAYGGSNVADQLIAVEGGQGRNIVFDL